MEPPPAHALRSGVLIINAFSEYPAVPNGTDHKGFAVMVHMRAPPLVSAEPVDLVAVLDVSESMTTDDKLAQVKRAMAFVVDRLGPRDRLSVVALSDDGAQRIIRLTCMTEDGKAAAKRALEDLEACGGGGGGSIHFRAGLEEAAKVLRGSRHSNDVAGVILVSGGRRGSDTGHDDDALVPPSLPPPLGYRRIPVHTFLLGSDDDSGGAAAAAMHKISEVTGGTFSLVEDHTVIQDALARCVAGILSTVVQDAMIKVECWNHEDMVVNAVKSGRYESSVNGGYNHDCTEVDVDDLYADEERRFLLFLDVPAEDDANRYATRLVNKVTCNYTDLASGLRVHVEDAYLEVLRPVDATPTTDVAAARCVEVERELLRVAAAEDIARAKKAAERGAYDEAARILDARRESLSQSALSGDAMCKAVAAELQELSQRVSDEKEYRKTGRACILASMSSHGLQRGSSSSVASMSSSQGLQRGSSSSVQFGCVGSSVFATPAMRKMEKLSEVLRKQQQEMPPQQAPLPENNGSGSKPAVPPRSRLEARLASAVPRLSMLNRYRRLLLKR